MLTWARHLRWWGLLALSLLLMACGVVLHDSPAPGCVRWLGHAPLGGCQGKHVITQLEVQGAPACLTVTANNCNGGMLEVTNACDQPLVLDGATLAAGERAGWDVLPTEEGFRLVPVAGNFAQFLPAHDTEVVLRGQVGQTPIEVRFLKTGPLCP